MSRTFGSRLKTATGAGRVSRIQRGLSWILIPSRQAISTISVWKISSDVTANLHNCFAHSASMLFRPWVSVPGYPTQMRSKK